MPITQPVSIWRVDTDESGLIGKFARIKIKKVFLMNPDGVGQAVELDTAFEFVAGHGVDV